jgi:DNA-binding transcriptional LysR family regulator
MSERSDASIPEITAFATVAQTGSFTKAAELLGITKSNVGKAVQRLEARLGTKLFQRTTRAVRLTEDGETYLLAAQAALEGLREAETALAARKSEPSGRVRIDLPSGLGRLLLPSFQTLRERFPKLTLEVALSDRMSDAVGEGWDIVVRIGELPADSEMTVRKLCDMRLALYAAPDYLACHAPVSTIADLGAHDAIVFRRPSGRLRPWTLQDGDVRRELAPNPVLVIADGQAMVDAAANCMGIAQIFDRVAAPLIQSGRLVQVLPATSVQGPPVHALIPLGQRMPSKTRAVLNHLAEQLNIVSI